MGKIIDQWANIDQDMLNEIAKWFHSYDDYLHLRFVCKQWNLKLSKILNANKVPWLVSSIAIGGLEPRDLEEKGIYHLMLPDMLQDNIIVGSCHGWLISVVIESHEGTVQILNPFTKVQLDLLPPVSTLPNVIDKYGQLYEFNSKTKPEPMEGIHGAPPPSDVAMQY
ncbi:hypothetical protein PIB30_042294 [Stylosanthes scabra]|uniref:KIB1-4 beta-propeller domain-containing protein n=1 Tax=Stylosanthes scabra TaxID=79078 RepID=A0ABU6WEV2_9FABA|nr:hypothetical protein [Stylosanthes scabra]